MIELHITITATDKLFVKVVTTEHDAVDTEKFVSAGMAKVIGAYLKIAAGLTQQSVEDMEVTHE